MKRTRLCVFYLFAAIEIFISANLFAQCNALDFNVPASVCVGQTVKFSANGAYSNVEWDFCAGDLSQTPIASVLVNSYGGYAFKTEVVEDNGQYYGFFLSRAVPRLYRLDFGSNINSQPILTDLGGLGVNSLGWHAINIEKEGNIFYGFIVDAGANAIYRISFGSSLTNQPSPAEVIFSGSPLSAPIDMTVVQDGNAKFIFAGNIGDNKLVRIALGSSFAVAPGSVVVDALTISTVFGIDFMQDCGTWYGIVSTQGIIKRIAFNTGLSDTNPTVTDYFLSNYSLANQSIGGVAVVADNGQFYAFTQLQNAAEIYRVNFGNTLANAPSAIDELQNLGYSGSDFWSLSMFKTNSEWTLFTAESSGQNIHRLKFPNSCFSTVTQSSLQSPVVATLAAGTYNIALRAQDGSGNMLSKSHTVVVAASQAPDIDFATQNICANSNVNFTASNTSGNILAYHWAFGDIGTGSGASVSHTYASAGNFSAGLTVDASNGCNNYVEREIQIYNQPVANFNLPGVTPICTNQDYTLTNTSTFDAGSSPVWEWRVNGVLVSGQQNLSINFNSPLAQSIKLKAIIPGCENEISKTTGTVTPGPAVDYSYASKCFGSPTNFTDATVGTVDAGYSWTFGDATSSTQQSPSHTYASPGTYQVTLTARNAAGCNNFKTTTLQIFSVPQPDFSVGAPPFSCNNLPTPFQNLTSALTDSNITTWFWQFNDAAGGASSQQNPSYVFSLAGTYSVTLTATSDAGCAKSVTKPTIISASPLADFSYGPSCLNLATKFTDLSSGSILSRNWQIGPATFTTQNPSYTFTSTGNFPVTLTVNSSNGCSSVKTKNLTVPVPPTLNFNTANLCAKKDAIFTDITSSPQDVVTGWNWNFDGNSMTGNPATFNFAAAGAYNTKLTTTHVSGCKYTLSKNVSINASPVASFIASPDRGAPPLTVQFVNQSQQATSYAWKFYDKTVSTSTLVSPAYTFATLGNYSAELTTTNGAGCSDVMTTPIIVLVPSIDLVLSKFSIVVDPVTAKFKAVVTIQNNGNVPVSFADVALVLSDKAAVNETVAIDLSPGASVTKMLSFTVAPDANVFLCAEIISEKDVQPANNKQCIKFDSGDYFFSPYPNPTAGSVQVDWIASAVGVSRIIVYDNMGRRVFDWQTPSIAGLNRATLDLSLVQTGLYYITIETEKSKKTTQLLIQ